MLGSDQMATGSHRNACLAAEEAGRARAARRDRCRRCARGRATRRTSRPLSDGATRSGGLEGERVGADQGLPAPPEGARGGGRADGGGGLWSLGRAASSPKPLAEAAGELHSPTDLKCVSLRHYLGSTAYI